MPVEFKIEEHKTTAFLSGEIDHHTAEPMRNEIDRQIRKNRPETLCLDFRKISFMDSSGVGLVMGRYRNLQPYGGRLELSGLSGTARRVMELSGIEKIATIKGERGETI